MAIAGAGVGVLGAGLMISQDGADRLSNVTFRNSSGGSSGGSGLRRPSGSDGGPGNWKHVNRGGGNANLNWSRYEQQVTGVDHGFEYAVINPVTKRPVKFDGYDKLTDTLQEVKLGYSNGKWIDGDGNPTGLLTKKFLELGTRQIQAANGKSVEWILSNEKAAAAVRRIFEENDLDITVRVEGMTNLAPKG